MAKPTGKQAKRNANSVAAASPGSSSPLPSALQNQSRQDFAELTAAQREYLASMRVSVEQMKEGDTRPLSELLKELGVEPMGNDQAHPDD